MTCDVCTAIIICMFILVEKDAFCKDGSMDFENNCVISSNLEVTEAAKNTQEEEMFNIMYLVLS